MKFSLLELTGKNIFEDLSDEGESLTQSDDSCLSKELYLLDDWPNISSHGKRNSYLSKVREDKRLEVISTHCHDEFQGSEHTRDNEK